VPASLTQGARVPIPGTDPLQYEEIGLVFEALYTDAPPVVATAAQAEAALGQLVQVSGQVGRAKLGDQVQTSEIALLCLDFRVPDELVGREATVEGELRRTAEFAATSDSEGAISQGTEPGTEMLVLIGCRVR
jgi:hypothetical protein